MTIAMECPHLCDIEKIQTANLRVLLENGKLLSPANSGNLSSNSSTRTIRSRSSSQGSASPQTNVQHQCQVCKSQRSPWMCAICGLVHCGRYVNSHAKAHFESDNQHFLALCCQSRSAFCYACDDYVINENQSKRVQLMLDQLTKNDQEQEKRQIKTTTIKSTQRLSAGAKSPNSSPSTPQMQIVKGKRFKLAGLRNLGNTCYMNSVIQCLSNLKLFTSSVRESSLFATKNSSSSSTNFNSSNSTHSSSNNNSLANLSSSNSTSNSDSPTISANKRKILSLTNNQTKSELLFETIRDTILLLRDSGKSTVIPESLFTMLCKVPRFRGYQQQDAHEFLRYVLDRLHQESLENCPVVPEKRTNLASFSSVEGKESSIIGKIFGGILQNEVNCLECGFKSHKLDPFLDLSLDIPSKSQQQRMSNNHTANSSNNTNNVDISNSDSNSSSNSTTTASSASTGTSTGSANVITTASTNSTKSNAKQPNNNHSLHPNLMDCLSSFIELEELTETELYYCSNCQHKQRSTKRFWIRRLPDVLCLHLKRFRWNNYIRTKIDSYIEFPLQNLDMRRFVLANKHETRGSSLGPTVYDLSAFIEHQGGGVGSGHYTAYAYHDGSWYHFDDSSVSTCEENQVRQTKPYILFYNRRTSTD